MADPSAPQPPTVIEKDLGGTRIRIKKLRPLRAFRALHLLLKLLGPGLSRIVTGAGLEVPMAGGDPMVVGLADLIPDTGEDGKSKELDPMIRDALVRLVVSEIAGVETASLEELLEALLIDQIEVLTGGVAWIPIGVEQAGSVKAALEALDNMIPDVATLIGALGVALRLNFLPTSAGSGTSPQDAAGAETETPKGT